MRTTKIFISIVLTGVIAMLGCGKERTAETTPDTTKPTITYQQTISSMYPIGTNVVIDVLAADNKKLKQVYWRIRNIDIDSVYVEETRLTDAASYRILDTVTVNLTTTMADFEVYIEVIDSAGNVKAATNGFHVMN
jgi:hypothetical protein